MGVPARFVGAPLRVSRKSREQGIFLGHILLGFF
jgi:hypothetical protein